MLRDGVKLSLTSALAATLLVPTGCDKVEEIADKVKGEESKDEAKDEAKDADKVAAKDEAKEAAPEEHSADPKVDPTPVKEAEVEPVPVEALHTGLDLMLKFVPSDKAEFIIARDATVLADYMEEGMRFVDGPIEKIKKAEGDGTGMMGELKDLVQAYDEVSKFHTKVGPALADSGLLPKEGMAMMKDGGAEFIIFNADDPGALKKFVEAVEPDQADEFQYCKAIESHEGWNVCAEKEADLGKYKTSEDPAPLRDSLVAVLPGIELEEANLLVHVNEGKEQINAAVTTIPGSMHMALAAPSGDREFDEIKKNLSGGEAKSLANVRPGAGFVWGHVDPKVLAGGVAAMGSDAPPPMKDFAASMTGDFVFAGSVEPAGMILQAGVSDASKFNGLLTLADMVKGEIPKEIPELGNAKVAFEKVPIEGGGKKAEAMHVGLSGINEADILKSYTGLHMDAWAFASDDLFTLAVGPNAEGVGKLLETHGTGPSDALLDALPTELADGLRKKEVSFAMHMPMDFLQGKQLQDLARAALKDVPDAKPDDILALVSLAAPFSDVSMWIAQPDDKVIIHMSAQAIGNRETEEGKVALTAAHAVVDGAKPEDEFGPIATKFAASPMAYAYKARAGTEGPGYMVGSGFGAVMAGALVAIPVAVGHANAALGDDLGVKADDPEPEIVEPTPPKKVKVTKKPAEPKKKPDPKKDEPKRPTRDPKKDEPKKDDPKKDDPVVEPKKPLPPKPTPDKPDPTSTKRKPRRPQRRPSKD